MVTHRVERTGTNYRDDSAKKAVKWIMSVRDNLRLVTTGEDFLGVSIEQMCLRGVERDFDFFTLAY